MNSKASDFIKNLVVEGRKKTLYINRKVLNPEILIDYARSIGITETLEPDDFHVTQMFSKTPVLWSSIPPSPYKEVHLSGAGEYLQFDGGAQVVKFHNDLLSSRFEQLMQLGCSYDFSEYRPHITISYKPPENLLKLPAIMDGVVLGPEIFKIVDLDWKHKIKHEKV